MSDSATQMQNARAEWQQAVLDILADQIHRRSCITYAALAQRAEIPPPHRIHKLTVFLEQLIDTDSAQNRPLRAALVISKTGTQLPARGFFLHCEARGLFSDQHHPSAQAFHTACLDALFASEG